MSYAWEVFLDVGLRTPASATIKYLGMFRSETQHVIGIASSRASVVQNQWQDVVAE